MGRRLGQGYINTPQAGLGPPEVSYRPELDGIRALAVLAVIGYHASVIFPNSVPIIGGQMLPGGFFGVDVFFVLSGYLITRILLALGMGPEGLSFVSVLTFYERRARRILPALLLVILCTVVVSSFLLYEKEAAKVGESALASIFFVSNFYFWAETSSYDASDSLLSPLLHTWSLAVEEQFYLLFPLLVLTLLRFGSARLFIASVSTLALVSFASAAGFAVLEPELNFFISTSRFWELMVGSVLAARELMLKPRGVRPPSWPAYIGLLLVVIPIVVTSETAGHPGWPTLLPVAGTALLILFSSNINFIGRFLSLKPLAGVGKISFSLYLWHFPLFAFGRLVLAFDYQQKVFLVLWGFVLSIATYYFVERPTRDRLKFPRRKFWSLILVASLTVLTISGASASGRLKGNTASDEVVLQLMDREKYRSERLSLEQERDYSVSRTNKPQILVVGNSQGSDFYKMLRFSWVENEFELNLAGPLRRKEDDYNYQVHCLWLLLEDGLTECGGKESTVHVMAQYEAAGIVMLATRWSNKDIGVLPNLIRRMSTDGKRVVVVSNAPQSPTSGERDYNIFQQFLHLEKRLPSVDELAKLEADFYDSFVNSAVSTDVNRRLQKIVGESSSGNVVYGDQIEIRCDLPAEDCLLFDPDRIVPILYDYGHLTTDGARLIGESMATANWTKKLLR
jgi:peptidoglycan/LPS O-acetylase OafA/YrhL